MQEPWRLLIQHFPHKSFRCRHSFRVHPAGLNLGSRLGSGRFFFWIHRRSKLEHKELTSDTLSPASFFPAKTTLVLGLHSVYQLFVPKFCQVNDGGTWSYVNLGSEKSQELMPGDTEGCLQKTTLRKFSLRYLFNKVPFTNKPSVSYRFPVFNFGGTLAPEYVY